MAGLMCLWIRSCSCLYWSFGLCHDTASAMAATSSDDNAWYAGGDCRDLGTTDCAVTAPRLGSVFRKTAHTDRKWPSDRQHSGMTKDSHRVMSVPRSGELCNELFLENMTSITQLVQKSSALLDQLHTLTFCLSKIRFSTILPSTSRSPQLSPYLKYFNENMCLFLTFLLHATGPSILLAFIVWQSVNKRTFSLCYFLLPPVTSASLHLCLLFCILLHLVFGLPSGERLSFTPIENVRSVFR